MMKLIDRFLDGITMYRLVLYYLILLVAAAAGLSAFGLLGYSPLAVILSALYLVVVCGVANAVFAYVFETPASIESSYITALILALIITPLANTHNLQFLTAAGGLAIASKYVFAINKRHIFNPAAIAVLLLSLGAGQTASWWVGNVAMLPFVVIGGLLVARKIRRLRMVFLFFTIALVSTIAVRLIGGGDIMTAVQNLALHSSLFFLGFIMLTEPLTAPGTARGRGWYAALVGALFPPQIHLLGVYSTPELALTIGNAFSYLISPKLKLLPKLTDKLQIAPDIVDFVLAKKPAYAYEAGQYVEVTLAHPRADSRGNRRYLTLASSPTEDTLRLGVKFYPESSSFKLAMLDAGAQSKLAVSPPAGDFTLPKDPSRKLAFIAGGIGVTPYRSMIKYLTDTNDRRDVVLLYGERHPDEFVYTDVFDQAAAKLGIRTVYTVQDGPAGWRGRTGRITAETIKTDVPDFQERLFYVSGSYPMVTSVTDALRGLGVPATHIKTDYFPGYA